MYKERVFCCVEKSRKRWDWDTFLSAEQASTHSFTLSGDVSVKKLKNGFVFIYSFFFPLTKTKGYKGRSRGGKS
jgi:hypothetical protein